MPEALRPTKKQREILSFIEKFIGEHGYSPSFREIMVGCDYKSVATIAVHIDNLIARGHLRKRDNSARSLELVKAAATNDPQVKLTAANEKWLIDIIELRFQTVEQAKVVNQNDLDKLYILVGSLSVLGFDGAALVYKNRLKALE